MSRAADYLRGLIAEEGGSISVERFMQEALYHPEFGYYARTVRTVGTRGDFSTSATLHPALGQAIAAWLTAHRSGGSIVRGAAELQRKERWEKAKSRSLPFSAALRLRVRSIRRTVAPWHVIELGAGTGELAAGILASLGWGGRLGLHYHIVEISAGLRAAQQSRLGRNVQWHATIADALRAADGCALLFSNEVVDAFPCRQMVWHDDDWHDVRVRWTERGPEPFPPDGQRIERHESYRRWLQEWAPLWRSGRLLTIDYGDAAPRGSTLRAYWHHRRLTGPEIFARFGQQDLTADVNFSDLETWGAEVGWRSRPLGDQAGFLRRWLPAKMFARPEPALSFLLNPDGAGGAFKTLEQWPAGSRGASGDHDVDFTSS